MEDAKEIFLVVWDWRWHVLSVLVTWTILQSLKFMFREELNSVKSATVKKLIMTLSSMTAGFSVTMFFLEGLPEAIKWAASIAVLNPVAYELLVRWATKKQWLWLLSFLKMRTYKVVEVDGEYVEKMYDDEDNTEMAKPADYPKRD